MQEKQKNSGKKRFYRSRPTSKQSESSTSSSALRFPASNQENHENLRDKLMAGLAKENIECMICFDTIRKFHQIWSCERCFSVYHLKCIRKWSDSEPDKSTWRCPGCQFERRASPSTYLCFCGSIRNPVPEKSHLAHSCGSVCGKSLDPVLRTGGSIRFDSKSYFCPHKCSILCHPGPCPPCEAQASPNSCRCFCGSSFMPLKCSQVSELYPNGRSCDRICNRMLPCKRHTCKQNCHVDGCGECQKTFKQRCFCGKERKDTPCGVSGKHYSCMKSCDRLYGCKLHHCQKVCHDWIPEPHDKCPFDPLFIKTCHCGKTNLADGERKACSDPIPTCGNICGRETKRPCGHVFYCSKKCHSGSCIETDVDSKCLESVQVPCRCKDKTKLMKCNGEQLVDQAWLCNIPCKKQKSCGKHRCKIVCCDQQFHICDLPCGKLLSCGLHHCESNCHKGKCADCKQASFDEWRCNCGNTILYPPIRCGQKMPECNFPCIRERPCGHATNMISPHNCHEDKEQCPPCMILVSKKCCCGKQTLPSIPCARIGRCPNRCGKLIDCGNGNHSCIMGCHDGTCFSSSQKCIQSCGKQLSCGHPCKSICHGSSECPQIKCSVSIELSCTCGNMKTQIECGSLNSSFEIECSDECERIQRNKRLARALQIDPEKRLQPRMPLRVQTFASSNPKFSTKIVSQLTLFIATLVDKEPLKVMRFPHMRSSHRMFIHMLIEEFGSAIGLESEAVDAEPYRSVVLRQTKPTIAIGKQSIKYVSDMLGNVVKIAKYGKFTPNIVDDMQDDDDMSQSSRLSACPLDHFHLLATLPAHFREDDQKEEGVDETETSIGKETYSVDDQDVAYEKLCATILQREQTDGIDDGDNIYQQMLKGISDELSRLKLTPCQCKCEGCRESRT